MPDSTVTEIDYIRSVPAREGYRDRVIEQIRSTGATRVLEIGGGAHPLLTLDEIDELGLEYTVLDISQDELDQAPDGYRKVLGNIAAPEGLPEHDRYDFAFSQMVAEHVKSGEHMHRNVYQILAPGGTALHFFPTMYATPFVVNRLVPEGAAYWLLGKLQPDRYGHRAKFPAHYKWCYGPTKRQQERLRSVGYEIVRYTGVFGHPILYARIPPLQRLHKKKTDLLMKRPVPHLTSASQVVLRKPADA